MEDWNIVEAFLKNVSGDTLLEYVGCYGDSNDRDLPLMAINNKAWVSPTLCVHRCKQLGYLFAALQGGNYCFCGNTFGSKTVCFQIVANMKNALVLETEGSELQKKLYKGIVLLEDL